MTVTVWAVVLLLFGHWLADFVFQPHWMSLRKSKEPKVLLVHASRITIGAIITGLLITFISTTHPHPYWGLSAFALINGVAHFGIDFVTSKMTSALYAEGKTHQFFVVIGFDQFLHTALAVATLAWLLT